MLGKSAMDNELVMNHSDHNGFEMSFFSARSAVFESELVGKEMAVAPH